MTRLLILLCVLSFTVAAKPPKNPPPPSDGVVWTKGATVVGVCSNYTPVVSLDATHIRVYSNTDCTTDGDLWLRLCSWSTCGAASKVLHITDARDTYIRTNAVVRGATGTYYALLYTGDGYPTQGGYSPSWATSPDGVTWTWQGPIGIFGRNQSSAAALIVDEARTDDFRFMAWLDGVAAGLVMMHSADGVSWTSDGLNVWPIAGESPQFVTAAKDQFGYHLIGANTYPATALRHAWSCDGLSWRIIETASEVINTSVGKGTNLVYEPTTNLLHALTSGQHWSIAAQPYPCT